MLTFLHQVCKTNHSLVLVYIKTPAGDVTKTPLAFERMFVECSVLYFGFLKVKYPSKQSDRDSVYKKNKNKNAKTCRRTVFLTVTKSDESSVADIPNTVIVCGPIDNIY